MTPLYRLMLCIALCAVATTPTRAALENQLKNNPAPYLAMHGEDPVHWQQWNAQTLERARRENKLVFVSVGFFSCYWCHVMQRESFRDAEVARVLNELFIPVIVDRELDPVLDAQLLQFVERFRGSAGWPLNVFITPQGHPILGGVYFPRQEFLAVLARLAERWKNESEQLSALAEQAAREPLPAASAPAPTSAAATAALIRQALELADRLSGGFGEQSKFPMSAQLLALLATYETQPDARLGEHLQLTLDRMAALGLRDHLSGGFFRYTADPAWRTPHFEKMLYDNALLATVYLRAARIFQRPDYERVARETLDFMLTRMRDPQGGFYASLSAVDELGVEGAYYLWNEPTLQTVLDEGDSAAARAVWNMKGVPPFEAGYLPVPERDFEHVAAELNLTVEQVRQRVDNARKKLLAVREQRQLPVDTKIIAGWNGLALIALSEAAALPGGAAYGVAARELRGYLVTSLLRNGELLRTHAGNAAVLEDYAYVTAGLLRYTAWSKNTADRVTAGKLVRTAWRRFYRPTGWVLTDHSVLPNPVGRVWVEDGALPSPSAWLIAVSLQLANESGDAVLKRSALDALARGGYLVTTQAFNYAGHVPLLTQLPR